jgi:hypothetical protein
MTPPPGNGTRILVGANSFVDARAALHLLARLTGTWQPSIGGLLVEDAVSLAICGLPNQRIVTSSGRVASAPTIAQVRTMIEADARAFKQSLARLAGDVDPHWTFERNTGDLIQTGLHMATGWDILVLAHRNIHPVAGKVVMLEPQNPTDGPMADMSRLLAAHLSAQRVVLTAQGSARPVQEDTSLRHQTYATLNEAFAHLARLNAQAVLVDLSRGPVRTSEELRHLVEVARCPVFVFGTVSAMQMLEHSTQIPPARDPRTPTSGQ